LQSAPPRAGNIRASDRFHHGRAVNWECEVPLTIDERLESLVERHEALTQSVELLLTEGRETGKRISALEQLAQQDGENLRALARIAEIHERRLTELEGSDS